MAVQFTYLGDITASVVGCNFYQASRTASRGDRVVLKRRPDNQYDSNAIEVLIHAGADAPQAQVGHLSRHLAAILAPLMDDLIAPVAVTGQLTSGLHKASLSFAIKLTLSISATSEGANNVRISLQNRLSKSDFVLSWSEPIVGDSSD